MLIRLHCLSMQGSRQHLCHIVQVDKDGDVPLEAVVAGQLLWKRILRAILHLSHV